MLLFKPEHIPMILNETKTQTRRVWKTRRVKVGNSYQCKTTLFGKPFATIKVVGLREEQLSKISIDDVNAEGYESLHDFMGVWMKINGSWNPNLIVSVVTFKLEQNLNDMVEVIR